MKDEEKKHTALLHFVDDKLSLLVLASEDAMYADNSFGKKGNFLRRYRVRKSSYYND